MSKIFQVSQFFLLAAVCSAQVDFQRDVEPIFHKRCFMCHGPSQQMSGFRLDNGAAALEGGYSGKVILPGNSGASKLIQRISSDNQATRMPPAGAPLTKTEIDTVKAWIDSGARWPERAPAKALSETDKAKHWAFRAIQHPAPPEVKSSTWVRNPVDRFILAKLEKEGVEPSPEADKITLARRLHFDLIGLPPAPEEVDRFLADTDPSAYEKLVDRLLASRHYGEKWAQQWLDAGRYADSDGYERDPLRPHAWRWRHWVINALNDDMPFDQFTIDQVAGDLLPQPTLEQRVATGFLRNGIKNREAGTKNAEKRFDETIDRVNTVSAAWLGLTVGCAQCHDHKFDPIKQKEFYQLNAFFGNTVEKDIDAPLPGEFGPFMRAYPAYRKRRDEILAETGIHELFREYQKNVIQAMESPGENTDWDFSLTEWRAANDRADWLMRSPESELTDIERDKRIDWFLSRKGPVFGKDKAINRRLDDVRKGLAELREKLLSDRALAYTMVERKQAQSTHIALRGDWRAPGLEVQPITPAVLPPMEKSPEHPRLRFARWLVSKENPLTARVTMNRAWQELFGKGLVGTSDDFGIQADPPTHPELLDWLASEFIERGWSRKQMHRLIVTSATYRQSSNARKDMAERDPDNRWLSHQNRLRLPAELVRDNALKVSGLLNPEIGGKSVHPPQPEGIAELSYSKQPWPEDFAAARYRRGMYIFFRRTSPYPMLITFDAPSTLVASVDRERSNTALQALNLLNDPVFHEAAQSLAARVVMEENDSSKRAERMFRLALARPPEAAEKDRISTYFERQKAIFAAEPKSAIEFAPYSPAGVDRLEIAAWTGVARGLMNLDEFMTRE